MSFFSNLFSKSKKNLPEKLSPSAPPEKSIPEPARGGTTLRKQEDVSPKPQKKSGPELSALEMAERQSWEVKSLPVWKPGDEILGLYRVEDVIETGGMGRVYIAHHKGWNVKLAIKSPNEMMLSDRNNFARVLREANSWTELGLHPNIAYCYYVRSIEDVPHIFVEYVDGGNLEQWIAEGKCIDYRVSLDLAIQFCHGMEHAHSKEMIHRDIKPKNILMTKDGVLKVTDFGLVRSGAVIGGGKANGGVYASGMTLPGTGTEGYMAPEQFEDPSGVDERADIFSFGVCLYEMCCGARPYDITIGPHQEAPDPISLSRDKKFPPALSEVLTKCVQWERDKRYGSFKEIRERLNSICRDLFNQESPYAEVKFLDLEADGLNNRGVSYLELGKEQEAIKCFDEALNKNLTHPEAVFNRSLMQWRAAEITDMEVLVRLDNCGNNLEIEKERIDKLKAFIYQESFNPTTAKEVLREYPGKFDELFFCQDASQTGMIRTMEGPGPVLSATITPDGRYAVSISSGDTLIVWELETSRCLRTMQGHTDLVTSVALTPDGRYVASGSWDKTIRVWELETGRCLRTMQGHTKWINCVAPTPDGRYAVSGSLDKTLRVWELETGRCLRTMDGHTGWVSSVVLTPDGRYAVSGSEDKTIRVWELETGRCLRTMQGHKSDVRFVGLSPDGRHAVSGSWDKTLRVWELETGRCLRTMQGHSGPVNSVVLTPDGRYAVSGSEDKTLRVWELETGRCLRTMQGHNSDVLFVALTPDGRYAVSGSLDKTLRVWELDLENTYRSQYMVSRPKDFKEIEEEEDTLDRAVTKAKELYEKENYSGSYSILYNAWKKAGFCNRDVIIYLYTDLMKKGKKKGLSYFSEERFLKGHTSDVNSFAITSDGRYAVSGSEDKTLRVWELETGRCIRTIEGHESHVLGIALTPDGRHAVSRGSDDKTLRVWELETGRCLRTMQGHTSDLRFVALTPDGLYAVSGSWDNSFKVWELETGRCLRSMQGHSGPASSIALTPDGRYAVSGTLDNTLRVWELETGRCLRTMDGHTGWVSFVALTSDGRYAVSGSQDNTLRVWELETGRCLRTMDGHTGWVSSVALTSDGRYAVSGSSDNTLRVWELETGQCLRAMEGHRHGVSSVALTPDSQHAISGSRDNTLRVWELIWESSSGYGGLG